MKAVFTNFFIENMKQEQLPHRVNSKHDHFEMQEETSLK